MNHHPLHLNDVYAASRSRDRTSSSGRWSTRWRSGCRSPTSPARRSPTSPPRSSRTRLRCSTATRCICESEVLEVRPSQSKPDRGIVKVHTRVYKQDRHPGRRVQARRPDPEEEPGQSPRPPRPPPAEQATPAGSVLARPEQPAAGRALAVKDLFDTAGLKTTYGSAVFRGHVPARDRDRRRAARGGRLGERRQGEPARVRLRDHLAEPALRNGAEPAPRRAGSRAARAAAPRRRSPPAHADGALGTDSGARSGSRRPGAASSASSPARAGADRGLLPARAELRPRRADGARSARAPRCRRDDRGTRAGRPAARRARVGVAWLDRADPRSRLASRRRRS